jgi:hypothetical protein
MDLLPFKPQGDALAHDPDCVHSIHQSVCPRLQKIPLGEPHHIGFEDRGVGGRKASRSTRVRKA